jgi:hypothetical protein
MSRYIIECDNPTDIIFGMRAIKLLIRSEAEHGSSSSIVAFEGNRLWYVKKTKTSYSARTAGKSHE